MPAQKNTPFYSKFNKLVISNSIRVKGGTNKKV